MRGILCAVLLLAGCGTTCPKVKETRCNGQLVEVCGSNLKWQRTLDCAQVKPMRPGAAPTVWTCKETPEGHTCQPGGEK